MIKPRSDERWEAILGMLESIASLDFSRSLEISDRADEMDAVASGLNMLSEELEANVVERSKLETIVTELEIANQELRAFSDALAHDLRNPLLIVTNFSHQLQESVGDSLDEQQKGDLQRIQDASRHTIHIIDDLRDLGDVNRLEIKRQAVDLSTMGRGIVDDLRSLVPDRDVTFEAADGINAHGDKTLLRLLLSNLLQNAWKYTRPAKQALIELGVTEPNGSVPVYHVRDNGIGFDNGSNELIFEPFERLHTRKEYAGSGLGLATAKRIVRRHGGRVWGEGTPGKGSVFRFTLVDETDGQ